MRVSYTLRTRTTGLTDHGTFVVRNAKANGVDVGTVNVMTMNYGWVEPSTETVEKSANGLHADLGDIYPSKSSGERWAMVGLTPMIGVNDAGGTHHLADARAVREFAERKGVGYLGFWSIDRDNGGCDGEVSATCSGVEQDPYAFTEVFVGFGDATTSAESCSPGRGRRSPVSGTTLKVASLVRPPKVAP